MVTQETASWSRSMEASTAWWGFLADKRNQHGDLDDLRTVGVVSELFGIPALEELVARHSEVLLRGFIEDAPTFLGRVLHSRRTVDLRCSHYRGASLSDPNAS